MSSRRKITVSSSISSRRSRSNERESEFQGLRPSVFSRLGTKRSPASSSASYHSKYASSHKMGQRQREDQNKPRKRPLHGSSPKVDTDWQNWNEESLDYEDERMLEKKRLLLQRELEMEHEQVPADALKEAQTKPQPEPPRAAAAASSSSSSSSSSDSTSSTSSDNSSDELNSKKNKKVSSTKRARKRNASSTESEEGSKKSNKLDKQVSKKSISKKKSRGKDVKKQSKRKKGREVAPEKKKDSPSKSNCTSKADDKPTPAIVDKFGFYHSQQPSSSSGAVHEGLKEGTSKRSTSTERRQQNSPVPSKKRKRRSSGSPTPRKRKSSPKSKQSYIVATSRSGNVGKGGDRDLRERRISTRKKPSLSPQRSSRKKGKGHKKAQLTGANSEPVDNRRNIPADRGLKRNRSKSDERLLPPQALPQKNTSRRSSSERSSTKNSRERTDSHRSPAAESQKCPGESDGGELSATEDFSEIGESDEEIFNQHNEEEDVEEEVVEKEESEQQLEENVSTTHDASFNKDKLKESDLLEGISEEELDLSDEEKDQKVKIADALGVDWSQLITPKENKKSQSDEPGTFRKQWTPAAIFSRIGLPKSLLGSEEYEAVIKEVNEQGHGTIEILHPIPTVHCYLLQKKKQDEKNLQGKQSVFCT